MTLSEEKELLIKIKADPVHFGVLFDTYYVPIFNYILRRLANYDAARDVASETFLKAYLNIGKFVWKNVSVTAWLYRIATNEINLYFRRSKTYRSSFEHFSMDRDNNDDEKESVEYELKRHDEFLKVQKCIGRLKIHYQTVLALRYFEKKSIQEIAEILNKNPGTVKSLLSRGLEKLRTLLHDAT